MRVGDVVAVLWVDSVSPSDGVWHNVSAIDNQLPEIISVGCVHKLDRSAVTLVASWSEHPGSWQVGGVITIPRKTIKKVVELDLTAESF